MDRVVTPRINLNVIYIDTLNPTRGPGVIGGLCPVMDIQARVLFLSSVILLKLGAGRLDIYIYSFSLLRKKVSPGVNLGNTGNVKTCKLRTSYKFMIPPGQ
jgi:hypothetical protein